MVRKLKDAIDFALHTNVYLVFVVLFTTIMWAFDLGFVAFGIFTAISLLCFWACDDLKPAMPSLFVIPYIFSSTDVYYYLDNIIPLAVCIGLFILGFVYFAIKSRRKIQIKKGFLFWGIMCCLLACIFGGAFSNEFKTPVFFMTIAVCAAIYLVYFIFVNYLGKDKKEYICKILVMLSAIIIIEMWLFYLAQPNILEAMNNKWIYIGFGEINTAALLLAMSIPAYLYLGLNRKRSYLSLILCAIVFIHIVFTFSRGVLLISLVVGLASLIYFVVKSKNKKPIYITLIAAISCAIVLALLAFGLKPEIFNWFYELGLSGNGRNELWKWTVEKFKQFPVFGVGFVADNGGNLENQFLFAHNTILQLLASTGIIGFLLHVPYFYQRYAVIFRKRDAFKTFMFLSVLIAELYGLIDMIYCNIFITALLLLILSSCEENLEEDAALKSSFQTSGTVNGQENPSLKRPELMTGPQGFKIYRHVFKRVFDILLSGIAIVVFSPVMAVVALIVRIDMGKHVIFTQYRPGKDLKVFKLFKFRSMKDIYDENGIMAPDSQRVTKVGRFIRKTSLDELPQLFNILKGDMSIVGPRPRLVKDVIFYDTEALKAYNIRPGLTGWSQIHGRNDLSWEEIFEMDNSYREHITLFGDLEIIIKTAFSVFVQKGAEAGGSTSDYYYGDYLLKKNKISENQYKEGQKKAEKVTLKQAALKEFLDIKGNDDVAI